MAVRKGEKGRKLRVRKRMETIALSVRAGVLMLRFPASSMESSPSEVTELLQLWSDGRKDALDRLLPLGYIIGYQDLLSYGFQILPANYFGTRVSSAIVIAMI